jgi:hypothetical protein
MQDVGSVQMKVSNWRLAGQQVINGGHQITLATGGLGHWLVIGLKGSAKVTTFDVRFQVEFSDHVLSVLKVLVAPVIRHVASFPSFKKSYQIWL